jgi:2-desacetyl-2-hydroxyethyl bacteriochlorophyllide A dehydrogenase
MKAVKIESPNQVALVDIELSGLKPTEVLVKVIASGICGTDIHILRGHHMPSYPVIPGHEFSGIVEQIGSGASRFQIGNRVAVEPNISCDNCYNCLNNRQNFCENWQAIGVTLAGGMAQYVIAPEKVTFNIEDLPFEHGSFMEPLSCVLHGLERVEIGMSDRVAILGAGPIGVLFLQTVRLQGAVHVSVLEKHASRAELAKKFGANRIVNRLNDLKENDFDVVIDATGVIKCMERTIDIVRHGGKVLLFGVPAAGKKMHFDSFKIFQKGLTILSSFTSVRNSFQAVSLLQSRQIDVSDLISHSLPLAAFERGVELIEGGLDDVKKVMILPQEA